MREGACRCGAVRYTVDGPVRDLIVCHCSACLDAAGHPWAASAAARDDLTVADATALRWETSADSEHDARRAFCRTCDAVVFWEAPARRTVSFAAETLLDASDLSVAAEIWLGEDAERSETSYPAGLPAAVAVPWHSI